MIPDGVFPAVVLSGGLGALAVRQGDPRFAGWLVVYTFPVSDPNALTEIARFGLPAGSPCFPGLYVLDGLTWLAFHDGQQQRLRNMATGTEERFPGLSNPSAFGAGYFAYTEPVQPYRVHRINLRTAEVDQPRLGAPTGLSRILDDGRVVTIDEDRHALPVATIPSFAGPLSVGEGRDGGARWYMCPNTGSSCSGVLWPGLDSFTPKCAADGETLAITTAGSGSVRLFCGTLAALIAASQSPPPVPTVPKEPGPIVFQPEVPVSVPNMLSTVQAVRRLYPTPLGIRHGAFLVDVAKATGGKLLRKDAGTNVQLPSGVFVSQDILVFSNGQECFDILGDGEGAATPAWSEKGFIAGEYIDVGTVNIPPVQPPVGQPPAQPPSGLDDAAIRRIVQDELSKPRNVALRTHDGAHYLCAEQAGGGEVNATRTGDGPWETFTLVPK